MSLNMEQIQQQIDMLLHDHSEQNRLFYEVFYDPEPQDVEMQIYVDSVLTTVTIPNRAKLTQWYQSMHVPPRNSIIYGKIDGEGLPAHLILNAGAAEIDASPTMLLLTIAAGMAETGPVDHIVVITADHIFSGLTASSTCWLYAARDASTGDISYGHTTLEPVTAKVAPTAPAAGQHWYDSNAGRMMAYADGAWSQVQRIFLGSCVTDSEGTVTDVYPEVRGESLSLSGLGEALSPIAHYTLDGVTDIEGIYDAGTGIFTPPEGARLAEITLVGGGGGGNLSADRTRTCGGASGAVCKVRVPVSAGDAYTVSIGAGGAGATSNTGNSGGDTVVTGPDSAWTATAGGGDGGEPSTSGLRNGGAVTCTGISPVMALKGIDNYALCEINTTDSDAWINAGSSAPGMGTCALAPYGVAPGQGGFARSTESPSGYAGGDGVVYVTVY